MADSHGGLTPEGYSDLLAALAKDLPYEILVGEPLVWNPLTLGTGWALSTNSPTPAQFSKDANRVMRFRGRLTVGSSGSTISTLPAGYRPGGTVSKGGLYGASAFNGATAVAAFVAFDPGGNFTGFYASGATEFGLDGITFIAER